MISSQLTTKKVVISLKKIIFDMDGVIFDSEAKVLECWSEIAEKYGMRNIREAFIKCIGTNSARSREIFLEFYGNDLPYDKYRSEMSALFHERYDNGRLPMKAGIYELLSALKADGYDIAIASSTRCHVVAQQIADAGIDSFFDVIIGGDMIEKSKPAPDIFMAAAKELNAVPSETYVIEDSFNGIRAAYAGGFIPIMVPDMLPPDDEMKAKARYIFKDLLEVKAMLSALS